MLNQLNIRIQNAMGLGFLLLAFIMALPCVVLNAKEAKTYNRLNKELVNLSPSKEKITLNDGSVWEIKTADQRTAGMWISEDKLRIEPSKDARYDVSIRNVSTNDTIQVLMLVPPGNKSPAARKITRIFEQEGRILLDDGSGWKLSLDPLKASANSKKWAVGDIVIVGFDATQSEFPYLLINIKQQDRSNARLD